MASKTEIPFTLPRGYLPANNSENTNPFREGMMVLAKAIDEIKALQDPRVQNNEAFLPLLLLSSVVELEGIGKLTPEQIAELYVIDLVYLEDLYERLNNPELVQMGVVCPHCSEQFLVKVSPLSG